MENYVLCPCCKKPIPIYNDLEYAQFQYLYAKAVVYRTVFISKLHFMQPSRGNKFSTQSSIQRFLSSSTYLDLIYHNLINHFRLYNPDNILSDIMLRHYLTATLRIYPKSDYIEYKMNIKYNYELIEGKLTMR